MKVRGVVVALTALLVLAVAVPASAGVGLNAYRANAKGLKQLRELKKLGFDLTEGQRTKGVEIVATKAQVRKLRRAGIKAKLIRTKRGRTALRAGAAQAAGGYMVWRPYARTDIDVSGAAGNPTANIKTQMENLAKQVPEHREARDDRALAARPADLRAEGHAERQDAHRQHPPGGALQSDAARTRVARGRDLQAHAETTSTTTTASHAGRRRTIATVKKLVNTRELWFVCVNNPDGYEYTFDPATACGART